MSFENKGKETLSPYIVRDEEYPIHEFYNSIYEQDATAIHCHGEMIDDCHTYNGSQEAQDDMVNDEIYDIIDAVIPKTDDINMPSLTFRVWLLASIFIIILAAGNTLLSFRTNFMQIDSLIATLVAYPLGIFCAWTFPSWNIRIPLFSFSFNTNPGPFTIKEHTLIMVCATCAATPTYLLYNIVTQKYMLAHGDRLSVAWCVLFAIATQCLGYGAAGLSRRFLVRPINMIWPPAISAVALLRSLHDSEISDTDSLKADSFSSIAKQGWMTRMSKNKVFWIATISMMIYQILPSFIAPLLSAVSLLCLIKTDNKNLRLLGSARNGVGLFSLSFDWSIIGQMAPIVTPFWAMANQVFGLWLAYWVIMPILWTSNAFGIDQKIGTSFEQGPNGSGIFPMGQIMNTPGIFDPNGKKISPISLVTVDMELNLTRYNEIGQIYLSTNFAVHYMFYFMAVSGLLSHVVLWYGDDIWYRFRTAISDLDSNDIHANLIDQYPEVPDMAYLLMIVMTSIVAIFACSLGGFDLPWWGVLLSILMSTILLIPVGVLEAISGQRINMNIIAEFTAGFIFPGKIASVMTFKTMTYLGVYKALNLVEDLKLGHYIKIPPRYMMLMQMYATILSAIINVLVCIGLVETVGPSYFLSHNAPNGWSAAAYYLFLNSGTIWGAIGPSRFYGTQSPYFKILIGFPIGLIAPFVLYSLHSRYPGVGWNIVSIPIIASIPVTVGALRSDLISPLIIAVLFNVILRKYKPAWWKKHAYTLSAAFDSGCIIGVLGCLLVFGGFITGTEWTMPFWALNRYDQESCASEEFLACQEGRISCD